MTLRHESNTQMRNAGRHWTHPIFLRLMACAIMACAVTPVAAAPDAADLAAQDAENAQSMEIVDADLGRGIAQFQAKFSQPVSIDQEDLPSNIDWIDQAVNAVVADNFISDGRAIRAIRWWGSNMDPTGGIFPEGWFISFHEPVVIGAGQDDALGLYFCETQFVQINQTLIPACDNEPVNEYFVDLANCCLIHANPDSRSGAIVAEPGVFREEQCFEYELDIQAVVGHIFVDDGVGGCAEVFTGTQAFNNFWGWHTTDQVRAALARPAIMSFLSMGPLGAWLYGPWTFVSPLCGDPHMAFELLTDEFQPDDPDLNTNGIPDKCEKQVQPKVRQTITPDEQDYPSNIDWTDMVPNRVVADDFISDGRFISCVRWWGSDLNVVDPPAIDPDGWLISFHRPVETNTQPNQAIGLYFCDANVVNITPFPIPTCDQDPVKEYFVELQDCCLIHSNPDERTKFFPAQPNGFAEQACFRYDLDIQAVIGHRFVDQGGTCVEVPTGRQALFDFWGWHTMNPPKPLLGRRAHESFVGMGPNGEWIYDVWNPIQPFCGAPHMAFELWTPDLITFDPDVNSDGLPDLCEVDCNTNGVPDPIDIATFFSADCNFNGIPDECEPDCNTNGVPDDCDITGGFSPDCNTNGVPDECDIDSGVSNDCDGNGVPDECDPPLCLNADVNCDGIVNALDLAVIQAPLNWAMLAPAAAEPRSDVTRDNIVNALDLAVVQAPLNWGVVTGPCTCCYP